MNKSRAFLWTTLALLYITVTWFFTSAFFGTSASGVGGRYLIFLALSAFLILAGRVTSPKVWLPVGLISFLLLLPPTAMLVEYPAWFSKGIWPPYLSYALFFTLILAVVGSSLLLNAALHRLNNQILAGSCITWIQAAWRDRESRAGLLLLALIMVILIKSLHNFYWLIVWDGTTDSLGYIWLFIPLISVILGGLILLFNMPSRAKNAGIAFTLLVPALFVGAAFLGQQVNFRELTEQRAERVSQAIERFYTREGRYPQSLAEIAPWPGFSLPGPVILYGQDWCYQSSSNSYRLGFVDREHWSSPYLFGQIYSQKGPVLDTTDICAVKIQVLVSQLPGFWSASQ